MPIFFDQFNLVSLRSRSIDYYSDFLNTTLHIKWSFKRYDIRNHLMVYMSCQMEANGITSYGYGDGYTLKTAMVKAFAEAWERWWMHCLIKQIKDKMPVPKSSNGFAAGNTIEMATSKSKEELIERHVFLKAWSEMQDWKKYHNLKQLSKVVKYYLKSNGWDTSFYLLGDEKIGNVLVCFSVNNFYGIVFDSIYFNVDHCEGKLLSSINRSIIVRENKIYKMKGILETQAGPEQHDEFYSDPRNNEAIKFLETPCSSVGLRYGNSEKIETILLARPYKIIPAVAYSYNCDWPDLLWGRQSISGNNKWPHPLA